MMSSSALATTYVGVRTAGTATATLSITTDGTIGALSNSNITDWTIALSDAPDSFTLQGPLSGSNSQLGIAGNALTATATGLYFNFSGSGYALFQSPGLGSSQLFYCLQASTCFDFAGPGEGIDAHTNYNYQRNSLTGNVLIASVGGIGGAVPEASTWMMMIVGFGAAGGAMRYRRRKTSVTFA